MNGVVGRNKPEKPAATSWIHGNRGSKDAVLVFRADILTEESPYNGAMISPQGAKYVGSPIYPIKERIITSALSENCFGKAASMTKRKVYSNIAADIGSNMPAFEMKLTYKLQPAKNKLIRCILNRHGLREEKDETKVSLLWTGKALDPNTLSYFKPYQRVNHFPRSLEMSSKDALFKNIERMQRQYGLKHFDIVPQSFIYPKENDKLLAAHIKYRGPWIVKPTSSCCGRRIHIVSDPKQIARDEEVVVSKYVSNPFCINGNKCDLRLYVLITSFYPLLIYLFEEGLVRLATEKYELKPESLCNPCIHLCNYSVNKLHVDYVQSNDGAEDVGHKWTLSAFLKLLRAKNCNTEKLMLDIEDLIIKAVLSCAQTVVTGCQMFMPNASNCFELYGFDILINDNLKPWLMEVNLAPSLAAGSPLDWRVKACLLTDLLTCVGIPAVDRKSRADIDEKWTKSKHLGSSMSRNVGPLRFAGGQAQTPLKADEERIIRNARQQNARRGGFVRIFPADDTMRRNARFLNQNSGLGSFDWSNTNYSKRLSYNYNHLLFNHLYGRDSSDHGAQEENSPGQRMKQYERSLPSEITKRFNKKSLPPRNVEESKRLRSEIVEMIKKKRGLIVSQFRKVFSAYLTAVGQRINKESCELHEKLILNFLENAGRILRTPLRFRYPPNLKDISRPPRTLVQKLLKEFLELYNRDTKFYRLTFKQISLMPTALFKEFLSQAIEVDLETVLSLQISVKGGLAYLYMQSGSAMPPTPAISDEEHGFLKTLPALVRSVKKRH